MNNNTNWTRIKGRGCRDLSLAEIMKNKIDNGELDIHEIIFRHMWLGSLYDEVTGRVMTGSVGNLFFGLYNEVVDMKRYYTEEEIKRIDWDRFFDKHYGRCFVVTLDTDGEECVYDEVDNEEALLDLVSDLGQDLDYCAICEKLFGQREVRLYTKSTSRTYVCDLQTNHSFDGYTWTHGLAAYSAGQIVENAINIKNNPNWEICCALENQPIGPIGLFITGDAAVVSNIDLYSGFDERGRYYDSETFRAEGIISSPDELSEDEWDHCEAIVRNTKITGLWVKDWYIEKGKETIKELEDKFGFKAIIVEARRTND